MIKLWERYLLREILKGVILFLIGCFFLYSILDYSFRSKFFAQAAIPFKELLIYYGWNFSLRLEVLLPLAVMLTTIRLLSSLNSHRELTAFLAGGIPLRKLLRPLFLTAIFCSALLYLNYESLFPLSIQKLDRFEDHYFQTREPKNKSALSAVRLDDGSKLLYHRYDSDRERFYDTFWIRSPSEIVRIKELAPYGSPPEGRFVDTLRKEPDGEFALVKSEKTALLDQMHFDRDDLFAALVSAESLSISDLWERRPQTALALSDRDSELLTQFYKKLTMPLFVLLATLGPAPFCVRFSRKMALLIVYGLSIMGFVTFLTAMGAAEILAEGHVLSPWIAMSVPPALFLLAILWPTLKVVKQ